MEDQSAVAKSTRMKGPTRVEVIDQPNSHTVKADEKTQKKSEQNVQSSTQNQHVQPESKEQHYISLQNSNIIDRRSAGELDYKIEPPEVISELPVGKNHKVAEVLTMVLNPQFFNEELANTDLEVATYPIVNLGNNTYFQGQMVEGKRSGPGAQVWEDGTYFRGYFIEDAAIGEGRLIHANGDLYQGNFEGSKANGHGRFIRFEGGSYEGEFMDDVAHGKGILMMPNGSIYQGQFVDGRITGTGEIRLPNQDIYYGEFVDNEFNGQGKFLRIFQLFEL